MMMDKLNKNKMVQGALLLTMAGFMSKVLSATYRIPLQNLTGDLGFYIYQQVYPLISMVMILSLYGYPVAISVLVAERIRKNMPMTLRGFYFPLFFILLGINGVFFVLIFITAPFWSSWMGDEKLVTAIRLAAFPFLLIPFLALMRGVFQGKGEMKQTAYSQVIEQVIRVTIIISVAYVIFKGRLDVYAIGPAGVFATIFGMTVAVLFLVVPFLRMKTQRMPVETNEKIPWKYYGYTCIMLGVVASLNHMVLLLFQIVDVFTLVPYLTEYGLSPLKAMEAKGVFDRGQPLIQFGLVFGSSFALALIPGAVLQRAKKENTTDVQEALLFGFYLAAGATIGLIMLMPEVNLLLFTNDSGTGSLQILAISILLSSVTITAMAILQGLGFMKQTLLWLLLACMSKWGLNAFLVPSIGLYGSALATVISLCLLMIAMLVLLQKKLPHLSFVRHIRWGAFSLASLYMTLFLYLLTWALSFLDVSRIGLLFWVLFTVIIGAFIYLSILLRYDVFTQKQLSAFPFATHLFKLQAILKKQS